MNQTIDWRVREHKRFETLLLAHGALIILIGLIAGFGLLFSLLGGVTVWPFIDMTYEFAGSIRGWKAAHLGGITNGLMMIGFGFALTKLSISYAASRFVYWSLLLTGWGNTLFYWGGNFSPNRGISWLANDYGQTNVGGMIAYIGGGSAMLLTVISAGIITLAAFKEATGKET